MKKLLFILTFTYSFSLSAQVNYFNYLDTTSEWYYYSGGNGMFTSYSYWTTVFIDGDTSINGKYYYKRYFTQKNISDYGSGMPFPGTYKKTIISGKTPYDFIREDSNKTFYVYNQSEYKLVDFNLQIDSLFYPNGCKVFKIDTVYLGTRL